MKKGTRITSLAIVVVFCSYFLAFCLFRDGGSQILISFFLFNWEVGELWHMTVLFYEKYGKALFFLNLISALKLDLFRGKKKKKGQIWGQFPVSLKALEKANHMVTQPLVTLCPYLFRFHPG